MTQHKKNHVVVFGGSGFLGSHVADELTSRHFQVTIFDKSPRADLQSGQRMIVGDILNSKEVDAAVQGADYVFNLAGFSDLNLSISHPVETIQLNVLGNTHILEACRKYGVERYVYASTVYVLSRKGSFYGVSKRCSESIISEYAREFSVPYTVVRYGSVYGTRADEKNRIYRLLKQALLEKKIQFLGNGEEEREYIHVRDAARLSVDILSENYKNHHVMLTGVERFKYSQLLNMIKETLNGDVEIEYLDQEYKGHYEITPYSFTIPEVGMKLVSNPYIDFGQGLLEVIADVYERNKSEMGTKSDRSQNRAL